MGARFYRLLARILPAGFREEYGDEMYRVAEEQWAARRAAVGSKGAWKFWLRQSVALLRAAAGLHRHENETTGGMTMEGFASDLRQGIRALGRRPGFALLTILTLGLGIGATTAIFSAVNTVILRPLPYDDVERVAILFRTDSETGERGEGVSAANIRDLRDNASLFEQIAVAEPWSLDLQVDGRTESLRTWTVSRGFFEAIGAEAQLGRTFLDSDYDSGASIVVMGHRAWTNRFDADPGVLGSTLTLDGDALTVVGVMGPDFRFPDAAEMWIPRFEQPWDENGRAADFMTGVVRLSDEVSLTQAHSEIARIATGLEASYPEMNDNLTYSLLPLREYLFGDVQTPLYILMAAVGFVLLIACANVAGLMLARGAQRERDYALRGALGAGTGRLVGHVVAESLILAGAGCLLGVFLTYVGVSLIGALGPDHLPRIDELSVDRSVLLFAVAVSAVSAVLSALAPSLRLSRPNLRDALGDGSRGASAGRSEGRARGRLVVAQVAGAVVLLVGAGLLLRSFGALLDNTVLGLVSMMAATSSSTCAASCSALTIPCSVAGNGTAVSPLSAHDAGLVPCAVSGMSTFFGLRPCALCHARIIIRPVSSPCAPAAGWSVTRSIPTISASPRSRRCISSSAPCIIRSGAYGWSRAKPARRAAHSLTFGLYFIVHEPSGYITLSIAKFC